ncbi:MAG: sigma 54-interacting transcriptional regulator [Candidatus Rokubacteria bacterium]|nr:sigma 54-interacting transcriptional regulator [Candidatus Rokubacteria bacterium]
MNPLAELLGESPGIAAVRQKIGQLLQRQTDARRLPPILIEGETGTGKGLLARAIHRAGPRRDGPFVDVNCAAIPETLLEAEMFGFERGAFTDARQAKVGLFQAAHRGTIFLDEIGLLPEALQAKLLKVIEEQAVRRLGSTRSEPVDVWILAATSEDLAAAARERRFREDLYHRLAVVPVRLPPLRERGRDILLLAELSLARACADYQLPPKDFDAAARAALLAYRWPGNVRELNNVIERVALLSEGSRVTADMLGLPQVPVADPAEASRAETPVSLQDAVANAERAQLLEALRQTSWNVSRAATLLGISRNTLRYRIERYGLRPGVAAPATPRRRRGETAPAGAPAVPADAPPTVAVPPSVRWERRRLTLLRADLVPPRQERSSVDASRQLEVLIDKVQSFGGRIEELSPTGIVAAFGIEPVEDAPRRAALSAMAIQTAARRAPPGEAEPPLAVKLGIHVAQLMVGRIGGRSEIDLDAKREAWTVLASLVAGSEPDAIVVSEAATPFLGRRFELAPAGAFGEASSRAHRLAGRERVALEPGGQVARFVGRREELEVLRRRLTSAMEGRGQVVGIVGEPGIGKSRLLFEFRQSPVDERITCLQGRCFSYATAIPYFPVLEILRANCGIVEADAPDAMSEKIDMALRDVGMDPTKAAPYLLHLLGLKDGTDRVTRLAPEIIKARTFETLRLMSLRRSRRNPLIIVVEDLHWIDTTSEEYFASLAEFVAGAPILLVATYRPGYRPPWIEKSYATQIALQPLTPQESVSLVRSVLGMDQVADSLVELILTKAEGNPFFIEELARTVREQDGASSTLAVPDTIEEVLLARINRLPPEEKRLLQSAAIVGKDMPFALVQAVADLPEEALRRGLLHLQAAEFLHETGRGTEIEYTFQHLLTHEVTYGSLLEDDRRALHARLVGAIEGLAHDRLDEQVERLARHAFRGGLWQKAVGYLRQAGAKAASRSAHREGVTCFEQALEALRHLPRSRETIEQAIDLRFDLRNSLHLLGELGRILDHLREAKALAEALDEQRRLGWVSSYMTQYFRLMGDPDRAIESGQRALSIAAGLPDFALQVATDTHLGPAYRDLGDYPRAVEILRRNVEWLKGNLSHEPFHLAGLPSVISRTNLVLCLAELGEFTEGTALGEEGIRIAEAADNPYSLISAHLGLGTLYLLKGDLERALPVLERGLGLCGALTLPLMFPAIASSLGSAYVLSGRLAEAIPLLEQAVGRAASMKLMAGHSIFVTRLGEAYLLAGRMDDAIQLAARALQLSRDHKERGHEAYALHLLGEIGLRCDPLDREKAEPCYRQALALAEELGMRPLLAHCHLSLTTLHRRTGDRSIAEQHAAAARMLFRQMDMRLWLERVEQD